MPYKDVALPEVLPALLEALEDFIEGDCDLNCEDCDMVPECQIMNGIYGRLTFLRDAQEAGLCRHREPPMSD
jgi:hypothetical protein